MHDRPIRASLGSEQYGSALMCTGPYLKHLNFELISNSKFRIDPVCTQIILAPIPCARRKSSGSDPKKNGAVRIRSRVHRA